jgi:hypothetical protein
MTNCPSSTTAPISGLNRAGQQYSVSMLFSFPLTIYPVHWVMWFIVQVFHRFLTAPAIKGHQVLNLVSNVMV